MVSWCGYTLVKSPDISRCPWSLSCGSEGKALHQSWSVFSEQGTEHGRLLEDKERCVGLLFRDPPGWFDERSLTCCKQCSANNAKLSTTSIRRSFSLISPLHNPHWQAKMEHVLNTTREESILQCATGMI